MNLLRKWPIRRQFYLVAYLVMAVIVVMQTLSYTKTQEIITRENEQNTRELFDHLKQTVTSNYEVINWLAPNIAYNELVQQYLVEQDPASKYLLYGKIQNLLVNLTGVKYGILDFILTGTNGNLFSMNSNGVLPNLNLGNELPKGAVSYFPGVRQCDLSTVQPPSAKNECFAVGTRINSADYSNGYGKEIGQLIILIDAQMLTGSTALPDIKDGSVLYLLDRANKVFMSNDKSAIGQSFDLESLHIPADNRSQFSAKVKGKLQHIQIEDLPSVGGRMVQITPDDVFFKDIRAARKLNILVFGLAGIALTLLFLYIVSNIIKPLQKLTQFIRIVRFGDLDRRIELVGSVEMEVISAQFNDMLSELYRLTRELLDSNERLYQAEIETRRSEIAFLKSQVNPHFLYNTLDSIRGIAAVRRVPEIRDIAKSLGDIFRYSIKGSDFVPLSEELRIVNAYILIQQVRFSNRFDYECNIPEELTRRIVPKMILQPLVENAVYHGIEPMLEHGSLILSAQERGEELIVTIRDNGEGIDPDKLKELNRSMEILGRNVPDGQGIGLTNLNNRLKLLYGNGYGVTVRSIKGKGTETELRLPVRYVEEEQDVQSADHR